MLAVQQAPRYALLLETLERLLAIPAAELATALAHACDAVAHALGADKVDAFLIDVSTKSLVSIGASNQPLSALQRRTGLDVLPLANKGRAAQVFDTGVTFRSGQLRDDADEIRGIREVLLIDSVVAAAIEIGGRRRGVLMVTSQKRDFFTVEDERFVDSVVRWVGAVAHRAELVEEIASNAVEQGRRAAADELITVLAHDLRNFMSPIGGRLQLLRRRAEADGRPADRSDAEAALAAVHRLNRMTTDMLDVSRIDHGLFSFTPEPTELGNAARAVAKALSTPEHAILVDASEEVMVSADPARVAQCLENLISNAVSHSPREAPVTVLVRKRSEKDLETGMVEVIDEGPGIAPEVLPRIFDRFAAGPGSVGLGLGLYLAQRIAVAHGGELTVESRPGKGSRFRLQLPAC